MRKRADMLAVLRELDQKDLAPPGDMIFSFNAAEQTGLETHARLTLVLGSACRPW